ncbi:hypothetical protein CVT26_009849 [Gymnopilus dilepis]|uniref:EF-hand domain-containing protein n=1 Tax=Gymnopilus dilepis TaxID=231916 RepID=A0A409WCT3_9AGAR|nr:hypothetical protein CVT26_009849 [Gymnopilus dilepis]
MANPRSKPASIRISLPDWQIPGANACGCFSAYRDAFSSFDKNGDGTITASELGMVMRSLGRNATDQDIQDILSKIDKDHNGTIEFSEFVDLMGRDPQSLTPGLPPGTGPWSGNGVGKSSGDPETDELRQAFNVFDKDGENLTDDELQIMIDEADLDGDHEISFPDGWRDGQMR